MGAVQLPLPITEWPPLPTVYSSGPYGNTCSPKGFIFCFVSSLDKVQSRYLWLTEVRLWIPYPPCKGDHKNKDTAFSVFRVGKMFCLPQTHEVRSLPCIEGGFRYLAIRTWGLTLIDFSDRIRRKHLGWVQLRAPLPIKRSPSECSRT